MEDYRDLATASNDLIGNLKDTSGLEQFLIDNKAETLEEFFLNASPTDILELRIFALSRWENSQAIKEANIYRRAININILLIIILGIIAHLGVYFYFEEIGKVIRLATKKWWSLSIIVSALCMGVLNPFTTIFYKIRKAIWGS